MKKFAMAIILILAGCDTASVNQPKEVQQQVWLEEESSQRGIDFQCVSGDVGTFNMPEIIGVGAAAID